jgi:hypothetical protein
MRQLVGEFSALGVTEISRTVCELLEWKRPNGGLKNHECRQLLERLASAGLLQLPALRKRGGRGPRRADGSTPWLDPAPVECAMSECGPLELALVEGKTESRLWREQMERNHYLGCRAPFGANLRYWVRNRHRELACLAWTSPAWKMQARDVWVGWSDQQRRRNLQSIVNNGRFLILPGVRIQGLASKILGLSARQMPPEWEKRFGHRPLLLETLVDAARFREPATVPPTGSMSGRPPDAVAWIASTKPTVERLKTSTFILWCAMPGNDYAEISRGKQIRLICFPGPTLPDKRSLGSVGRPF